MLESKYGNESATLIQGKFFSSIGTFGFTEEELKLILQGKEACEAALNEGYGSGKSSKWVNCH